MSVYGQKVPLHDSAACADWLINGLERFNASWREHQVGVSDAFPGHVFSNKIDIPSQFSDFFANLDFRERRCVRDAIADALLRFELSRGFWYGTCVDLIRLALNFDPKLINEAAPALLTMCREAASHQAMRDEAEELYANIVSAVGAQQRFNRMAIHLIEGEIGAAKSIFPRVLPLLCNTVATCKPHQWTDLLLTALAVIWPDRTDPDEAAKDSFQHVIANFGATAQPQHVGSQLQRIYLNLRDSVPRFPLFLSSLLRSDRGVLSIESNRNLAEGGAPFLVTSTIRVGEFPVKFNQLDALDVNRFEAVLSDFVFNSFERNLEQIAA
jgi:hypothetical protein